MDFVGDDDFLLTVTDDRGGRTNQRIEVAVAEGCKPVKHETHQLEAGGEQLVLDLSLSLIHI